MGGGASARYKDEKGSTEPDTDSNAVSAKAKGNPSSREHAHISSFLEKHHQDERAVLQDLLGRAAVSCGGTASFYSAPGASGRNLDLRCHPKISAEDWRSKFFLVATVVPGDKVNEAAPKKHESVLKEALAAGFAKNGRAVASRVMISEEVEGMLLMDLPDSKPDCSGGCELWALLLAERLEKVRMTQEALASKASLESVTEYLERFVTIEQNIDGLVELVAQMIPQQVMDGSVKSNRTGMWFLDDKELVLNDDGQLDGIRAPLDHSVVGLAVNSEGKRPLWVQDVKHEKSFNAEVSKELHFQTHSMLCVPFVHPATKLQAVMTFRNGTESRRKAPSEPHCIDHFDLVGAERLQKSVLSTMLWNRDAFLQILFRERQREALQAVVSDLVLAADVKQIIQIVQLHIGDVMNCERCTLFFVDHSHQQIWSPASSERPNGIRVPIGDGLVGHVAKTAVESAAALSQGSSRVRRSGCTTCPVGATRVNDPKSNPHWAGDVDPEFTTRNLMTAPVWSSGKDRSLVGLVQTLNKGCRVDVSRKSSVADLARERTPASSFWTERDAEMLEILAEAIGEHLQRLMLDMMWSKASFDAAADNVDPASIMQEFYGGGSFKQLTKHNTVHRMQTTTVAAPSCEEKLPALVEHEDALDDEDALKEIERLSESLEAPDYEGVQNWGVDYWEMSLQEEFGLIMAALRHCDAVTQFSVPDRVLFNFFSVVKASYNEVPYHGFTHAIGTVHYTFKLMQSAGVFELLDKCDIFAVIWGALCHDIGHRGRNNAFEVMTRSELALRYNDSSPLENHHCAKAFELALNSATGTDCNIFQGMDSQTYNKVRKMMVAGILSTDMVHHVDHVGLMQEFRLGPAGSEGQSQFLVEVFMHTADISNVMMPRDIAAKFTLALSEEFSMQADEERTLGLPVTQFMDGLRDPAKAAKSTLGFIDFVVQPLMEPMFRTFRSLVEPRENLEANRKAFQDELAERQ